MIRRIFKKNTIRNASMFVEPDEIFLDSKNVQNFDRQQFEGRIEKPITKKTILVVGISFFLMVSLFGARLGYLQIKKGEAFFKRSEDNTLAKAIIFADRGIIYDRNGVEIAWNKKESGQVTNEALVALAEQSIEQKENIIKRAYMSPGFSHVLGYVSSPTQDSKGKYWQTEFIGKDGLEKQYSDKIKGENGSKIVETDAHGEVYSENIMNTPKRGADLVTSIDSRIQSKLFSLIQASSNAHNFQGGAGIIMDVRTGEILASTSFPEYDSAVLSEGKDKEKINSYLTDKRKVFLDKTISGLYTPGSIVKPFLALGALKEGIINPNKQILSTGSISIPNPYDKTKPTIFKDWKAHGWTDMREAIAVSSDVYFYSIGGGFEGQTGLGISRIEKYAHMFGIGQKTGVDIPDERGGNIPNPEWKLKNFKGDPWRVGDTYHTAIGQYGFQVTPLEMVRATAALANGGILRTPHFLMNDTEKEKEFTQLDFNTEDMKIIREGMRMTVTEGTAKAIDVPFIKAAAKTGTAQLGINKNKVNSWVIGFFPYDNPKYAFTILMEAGPAVGTVGASTIIRGLFDWMYWETPEYFDLPKREKKVEEKKTEEIIQNSSELPEVIPLEQTELEILPEVRSELEVR
ncbi:MAG: penicillin-binding transpeptidase domain-containing protein [Patescibacteria group bacterium]